MNKWKDTAITTKEIVKKFAGGEKVVLSENSLVIIEKELSEGLFMVSDINPRKAERKRYKIKISELVIENYSDTRDINIQMLLADGWDAQDLLRRKE